MSSKTEQVAAPVFDVDAHGNNAETDIRLVAVLFADSEEKRVVDTVQAGVPFPRGEEELPDGVRTKDNRPRYPAIEFTLADIAPEVTRIKVVARTSPDGDPLRQASFIARSLNEGQSYAFDEAVEGVRLITFTRDGANWSYTIDLPPETW